jgi:hypothetical protein
VNGNAWQPFYHRARAEQLPVGDLVNGADPHHGSFSSLQLILLISET